MAYSSAPRYLHACAIAALAAIIFAAAATRANAGSPPLRVILTPALMPDVVAQALPIDFSAAAAGAPAVKLVAAVWCGAAASGGADAIGVVFPNDAPAAPAPPLASADCSQPLDAVAKRALAAAATPWLEAVRVHALWRPWRLRLNLADSAGAARAGASAPDLLGLPIVHEYPTSNLHFLTGPGANAAFDVAVGFRDRAVDLVAFPSRQIADPSPYLADSETAAMLAAAPAAANVIAAATYPFINQILRLYGAAFPIPIPIQGVNQTMTASDLAVSGGDRTMTASGKLEWQSIAYDAAVRCAGDDLAVSQITIDAPAASGCAQDDLLERMRCQGSALAMNGSAGALANALTNYYGGQPLHVSTRDRPLAFSFGGSDYLATFDALKAGSTGDVLSEDGRARIRRVAPP